MTSQNQRIAKELINAIKMLQKEIERSTKVKVSFTQASAAYNARNLGRRYVIRIKGKGKVVIE